MRYVWIDGMYIEVKTCDRCPFFSTEYELGADCKYPQRPSKDSNPYLGDYIGVAKDCPLRVKEE